MSFFGGHIPVGKVIVGLLVDLLRVVHDHVCLMDDMTMFDGGSSKACIKDDPVSSLVCNQRAQPQISVMCEVVVLNMNAKSSMTPVANVVTCCQLTDDGCCVPVGVNPSPRPGWLVHPPASRTSLPHPDRYTSRHADNMIPPGHLRLLSSLSMPGEPSKRTCAMEMNPGQTMLARFGRRIGLRRRV